MLLATRPVLLAAVALLQVQLPECDRDVPGGRAHVDTSTVFAAGRGLFASEALPAHSLVSIYPAHGFGVDESSGEVDLLASTEDMAYFAAADKSSEYRLYLRHDDCGGLSIDANPTKPIVAGWEAHLVNDACACIGRSDTEVEAYLEGSVNGANCALVAVGPAPLMAVVTTRDVAAGDELFVSYGPSYWVGGPPIDEEEATRRRDGGRVLDAAFWNAQGTPRTVELLAASVAAARAAEEGVRTKDAAMLATLEEEFRDALDSVREMMEV